MKSRVVLLFILILLSSCSTINFLSKEERLNLDSQERIEKEREALEVLAGDMVEGVESWSLSPSLLENALSSEYELYGEYFPRYSEVKNRYLESIASIVNDIIKSSFPTKTLSLLLSYSENPEKYISGSFLPSNSLSEESKTILLDILSSALEERRSDLDGAFSESKSNFDKVREAYANLSLIGVDVTLSEAKEADIESIAQLALEGYLLALKEVEEKLRNNPNYSNESYSIFWRD